MQPPCLRHSGTAVQAAQCRHLVAQVTSASWHIIAVRLQPDHISRDEVSLICTHLPRMCARAHGCPQCIKSGAEYHCHALRPWQSP